MSSPELSWVALQRPRDVFWKIKVMPAVPPCPEHSRAGIYGQGRAENVGTSCWCFIESRLAWEGLKVTVTTPGDTERDKNKRKVFWKVSAGPGHTERLQRSQQCTKAKSSRLQNPLDWGWEASRDSGEFVT